MSEATKNGGTVADITRTYFPSAKMAGLIVATLLLGMWIQRQVLSPIADSQTERTRVAKEQEDLSSSLSRMESDISTIRADVQFVKQSLPSLEARIIAIEKSREEKALEDKLWRDAVWGRVQDLPYKVPSERQSAQRP